MYKEDLALNDPQGLICHKTQTNKKKIFYPKFYLLSVHKLCSLRAIVANHQTGGDIIQYLNT